VNKLLTFPAADTLVRAKAGKGPPRVRILAYTGGSMKVDGWGDVAIDLRGLKMPEQLTLLADHENALGSVVGTGRPQVKDNQLTITGTLVGTSAGVHVADLLKAGVGLGASVGVAPNVSSYIKPGQTVRVNGRSIEAGANGLTLVSKGELKEVSIVALAADADTRVSLAARRAAANTGNTGLDEDRIITATDDESVATDTETVDVKESQRLAGIARLCGTAFPAIEAKAIAEGWDLNKVELEILRAKRPVLKPCFATTPQEYAKPHELLTAALLLRAGRPDIAEKQLGARVAQQAADLRCHSLLDICATAVRASGQVPPRDRVGLIRAALSSIDLSNALADAAGKFALESYRETPSSWRAFANVVSCSDFKSKKLIRILCGSDFSELPPGGEIHHGTLEDSQQTVTASTRAMMLSIDRRDIINDDLGIFQQTAAHIGRAGARTVSDLIYTRLLANKDSADADFFSVGNSNLLAGTDTALSSHALTVALADMAARTDAAGHNLDLRARVLLVPPALENSARELLASTTVARYVADGTDRQPEGNVHFTALTLAVEPRLSNSTLFTGTSAVAWYLFAAPADGAVVVSFLDGKDSPTIEQAEQDFNTLGLQWRGYIDVGCSLVEPLAATKCTGEAE